MENTLKNARTVLWAEIKNAQDQLERRNVIDEFQIRENLPGQPEGNWVASAPPGQGERRDQVNSVLFTRESGYVTTRLEYNDVYTRDCGTSPVFGNWENHQLTIPRTDEISGSMSVNHQSQLNAWLNIKDVEISINNNGITVQVYPSHPEYDSFPQEEEDISPDGHKGKVLLCLKYRSSDSTF